MKKICLFLAFLIFLCSCQKIDTNSNLNKTNDNSDITINEEILDEDKEVFESENHNVNPDTNIVIPEFSNEVSSFSEENEYNYIKQVELAEKLEKYLRKNLSDEDYGGMYILKLDTVSLNIWVVNKEKVESVIGRYSEKPLEINCFETNCSYKKLTEFAKEIEQLSAHMGKDVLTIISEEDNWVAINLSQNTYSELANNIYEIIQNHSMPENSWKIVVLNSGDENPNT